MRAQPLSVTMEIPKGSRSLSSGGIPWGKRSQGESTWLGFTRPWRKCFSFPKAGLPCHLCLPAVSGALHLWRVGFVLLFSLWLGFLSLVFTSLCFYSSLPLHRFATQRIIQTGWEVSFFKGDNLSRQDWCVNSNHCSVCHTLFKVLRIQGLMQSSW